MRGSCPASSVLVEAAGQRPLLLDLGTGVSSLGRRWDGDAFVGAALITHLHYDHVLGLPFFEPANRPGARLDIYGPAQRDGSLAAAFATLVQPPYFPLHLRELQGRLEFVEVADDRFSIDAFEVASRLVPHLGPTVGYRIECGGRVLVYVSDHQAPPGLDVVPDAVVELCAGADVLIHDAQYTEAEFHAKPHWGHSSVDYAVAVARAAGARRLILFHHDPAHGDDQLDEMLGSVRAAAEAAGVEVTSAAEGDTVTV